LLLNHNDVNILIYSHTTPENQTFIHAQSLHPPTLLNTALTIKREESWTPDPEDPFGVSPCLGEFVSIESPARIAREASCSHFTAKLESPGRTDVKNRTVRRVERLLPDLARRKKVAENVTRESSVAREGSVVRMPEGSVVRNTADNPRREVVRQVVIAALRLQEVQLFEDEYKTVITHTVQAGMFALRNKFKGGKNVGMGEIGEVVESLLKIFLESK
jgi:hypothetical protein